MDHRRMAVHRTIVVVDVVGFGQPYRTNRNQLAVRNGLYNVLQDAFLHARIPWVGDGHEDRGDGVFILIPADVPKGLFVESLPSAMVKALHEHNDRHPPEERIRLRMALHAGEVNYDDHGVTSTSINLAFRLLDADDFKVAVADSASVLGVIVSPWFYEEVVRHTLAGTDGFRRIRVAAKETSTNAWICLLDISGRMSEPTSKRLPATSWGTRARPVMALRAANSAATARPITPVGGIDSGLLIPSLGDGYIDHRIRVAEVSVSSEPARESWWDNVPVHDSAYDFFARYLISANALRTPVILLGQPGSGKSVFTRILAARLAPEDFLPVRVELRQVPGEADLQEQIEFAVRESTGERISWPQLVESAAGILPVVMLDGLDELLLATGLLQADYLLRVRAFQDREAVQGRPLAVIVTSRTAVADRARIPEGAMAVRLEPFSDDQVAAWLGIWARSNGAQLEKRGLRPLSARTALKHKELAEQPLLLLMLALYDAEANVLQRRRAELGRTELYERLLEEFARREISKDPGVLSEPDMEQAVEAELLRLSIAAFAMFNRRSQWVSEPDLDSDLAMLLGKDGGGRRGTEMQTSLTAAQVAISRFFFIYTSRASRGNRQLQTYEFLHATFGEFLVARLVSRALHDMLARPGLEDGLLHALLSFAALTASATVISFLDDLIGAMDSGQRAALTDLLLQLNARSLYARPEQGYHDYEPLQLAVTTRYAAWNANLTVLAVLAGEEITSAQLFPDEWDSGLAWRNRALMWRSQLAGRGWEGLYRTIALKRVWDGQQRGILLWRNDGTFAPPPVDIFWTYTMTLGLGSGTGLDPAERTKIFAEQAQNSILMTHKMNFVCNMAEDTINHGSLPITSSFPAVANVFVMLDDRPVSATHAMAAALIEPYQDGAPAGQVYRELASVAAELARTPTVEPDRDAYIAMALAVLGAAVARGAAQAEDLALLTEAASRR